MNIYKLLIFSAIIFILAPSCKKNIRDDDPDKNNNTIVDNQTKLNAAEFEKKYLREGFITGDLFRVVILSPKGHRDNIEELKNKAEKRCFVTLQKYLRTQDQGVKKNCRAKLLDIIQSNGKFTKKDFSKYKYKSNVYFFDIKRKGLKRHIKIICER